MNFSSHSGFDNIEDTRAQNKSKNNMDRYGSGQSGYIDAASSLIHTEPVVSLASIQPGLCLSGSKDKVCFNFYFQFSKKNGLEILHVIKLIHLQKTLVLGLLNLDMPFLAKCRSRSVEACTTCICQ